MRTPIHRLLLASTLLVALSVDAQTIRLNAFSGYTFQDKFPIGGTYYYGGYAYTYSEGVVDEGAHFGGSIEFEVRRNKSVELLYQNQPTEGYLRGGNFTDFGPYDVSINYIMLGGLNYVPFSDMVKGYGGLNLGCAFATGDAESTKFAWGGKLGLMIEMSPTVGLKLGAQLLSPVQSVGTGFYFGTGGASAGVSTYSSVYQFAFTGGLVFSFPRGGAGGPARPAPRPAGGMPPPPPPQR